MKHIMSKKMFDTNTDYGIQRYLSTKGFDVSREITYEKGPNKNLVCAVQEPLPEPVERKELIKKRAKAVKNAVRKNNKRKK